MAKPVVRAALVAALILLFAVCAATGYLWWQGGGWQGDGSRDAWWQGQPDSGADYVANGRLEAVEIQLASRLAGRLEEMAVEEGDAVAADEVVARLDSGPLQAEIARSEAAIGEAERGVELAHARREEAESECHFARTQLKRLQGLASQRHVSEEQLDAAENRVRTSAAGCRAAAARVGSAEASLAVAQAARERLRVDLDDLTLTAPISGRIQYRLAEEGEVIPAGGRVVTLISDRDVYLTVFVPSAWAGRLRLGAEQPIHLDAYPQRAIPARIRFVSPEAQFTPKSVETREERAKLMFRIKLQVEPEFLTANGDWLKPGMPGEARFTLPEHEP